MTAMTVSDNILFKLAPINAPASVDGSITSIKSQSISGRSALGCRLLTLRRVLATAPPKTVTFDNGIACLGINPRTRIYIGTSIPPPPIPPPAAIMRPSAARLNPMISLPCSGHNGA